MINVKLQLIHMERCSLTLFVVMKKTTAMPLIGLHRPLHISLGIPNLASS